MIGFPHYWPVQYSPIIHYTQVVWIPRSDKFNGVIQQFATGHANRPDFLQDVARMILVVVAIGLFFAQPGAARANWIWPGGIPGPTGRSAAQYHRSSSSGKTGGISQGPEILQGINFTATAVGRGTAIIDTTLLNSFAEGTFMPAAIPVKGESFYGSGRRAMVARERVRDSAFSGWPDTVRHRHVREGLIYRDRQQHQSRPDIHPNRLRECFV